MDWTDDDESIRDVERQIVALEAHLDQVEAATRDAYASIRADLDRLREEMDEMQAWRAERDKLGKPLTWPQWVSAAAAGSMITSILSYFLR